jgi:hypothetical protein
MNIICISKGTESKGTELAGQLATKLGYHELSRTDLVEAAIDEGIAVGRLETAMLKSQPVSERLTLEKEYYQAFATQTICERALAGDLLYHGRAGHLLLPGVTHVMKVRVVQSEETLVDDAMARMDVPWKKARDYVQQVNEDIARWVKSYYSADFNNLYGFNMILNLDEVSPANAATALCSMASLPEFQGTPSMQKALKDLLLAARVRICLARSERTAGTQFHVTADGDVVNVSYLPQDDREAALVPEIVASVDGISELNCTMASSHILWIQEQFKDSQEACMEVGDLALKYNAAVEVVCYKPGQEIEEILEPVRKERPSRLTSSPENGGIEDDEEEPQLSEDDAQIHTVHDRLVLQGVAGGTRVVKGPTNHLLESLDARVSYFLVVIGDLFLAKGHAARVRMTRELSRALSENLRSPVVGLEQLHETFRFGPRQVAQMIVTAILAAVMFAVVFWFQGPVLEFIHSGDLTHKIVTAIAVTCFIPLFAYTYGTFTRKVLTLIRME